MVRAILCTLLLFASPLLAATERYEITEHPYTFSTYFELNGADGYVGRIVKSKFHVRTHYNLYNERSEYVGQGISQMASLGSIYAWGKDFDIYDSSGAWIGMIDGVVLTSSEAKFVFYNHAHVHIATAYMNNDRSGFILVDLEGRTFALLKRNFVDHSIDSWNVTIYNNAVCDPRILRVFVGFAIDYQEHFKPDL